MCACFGPSLALYSPESSCPPLAFWPLRFRCVLLRFNLRFSGIERMSKELNLAAIIYDNDEQPIDKLLHRVAATLNRRGDRVAGLSMALNEQGLRREPMALQDLETGQEYPIAQNLGRESQSCCLDPSGLADATRVLRSLLEQPPRIAVVNRFGQQEIDGKGCRAEFVQLLEAGIPVL